MAPMLSAKQVGPLLGLSARKVYELASTGALPSFRFGDAVGSDRLPAAMRSTARA